MESKGETKSIRKKVGELDILIITDDKGEMTILKPTTGECSPKFSSGESEARIINNTYYTFIDTQGCLCRVCPSKDGKEFYNCLTIEGCRIVEFSPQGKKGETLIVTAEKDNQIVKFLADIKDLKRISDFYTSLTFEEDNKEDERTFEQKVSFAGTEVILRGTISLKGKINALSAIVHDKSVKNIKASSVNNDGIDMLAVSCETPQRDVTIKKENGKEILYDNTLERRASMSFDEIGPFAISSLGMVKKNNDLRQTQESLKEYLDQCNYKLPRFFTIYCDDRGEKVPVKGIVNSDGRIAPIAFNSKTNDFIGLQFKRTDKSFDEIDMDKLNASLNLTAHNAFRGDVELMLAGINAPFFEKHATTGILCNQLVSSLDKKQEPKLPLVVKSNKLKRIVIKDGIALTYEIGQNSNNEIIDMAINETRLIHAVTGENKAYCDLFGPLLAVEDVIEEKFNEDGSFTTVIEKNGLTIRLAGSVDRYFTLKNSIMCEIESTETRARANGTFCSRDFELYSNACYETISNVLDMKMFAPLLPIYEGELSRYAYIEAQKNNQQVKKLKE